MRYSPSVTVVIPTVCRPLLLQRAIKSVLDQTQSPLEIIVVVDGGDNETLTVLEGNPAPSMRVICVGEKVGSAEARNIGVRAARGDWIAFLDDDDEWLPEKLYLQGRAAVASSLAYPIVFSRISVRTPFGNFIMPRRRPDCDESICDYLFRRRTVFPGEVLLQTSNLLASRELLTQIPLRRGLHKWDDTDWLLRTQKMEGSGLVFIPEVLSIWYAEDARRHTVSGPLDWKYLFDWAVSNRRLFSPQAYSGVMLVRIAQEAARQRAKHFIKPVLTEAIIRGSADWVQLTWFLAALPSYILSEGVYARVRKSLRLIAARLG